MLKAGVLAEPVLVGRERELEELESFLDSALEGKGKTVFVAGEAGSGKTRLAREFLSVAKKKGVTVMAGWCLSDAEAPYFPFVEAFNAYFTSLEEEQPINLQRSGAQPGLTETTRMASTGDRGITAWLTGPKPSEKPGKPEVLSPQVWKDQVFAGVARTLHEISVQSPIVLFIEDIQWADSASLALLHYVARAVNNSEKVLVLATFRSEELTADAEGRPHPLAEALRLMRREDLFTEIKLSSLDQGDVSKIAESMIGGRLQPELAEKLAAESRGNPLFVVESLRMLHERKSLFQEDNKWLLAVDELGIPSKIKDIILRRLAILKYAQRRVLDTASVIGEKFDVELLSTVLGLDSLEVLETLNVIAHSTSLVSVEENFYRFDHAKSRETLYEELSPPLKRGYHGRIAEKLESAKGAALPLSDLAYHFAQAGNKEKALKYALEAGKDELARFSNQQAIQHFTYALQNIPDGPESAEQRRTAKEGLGDAYAANNMYAEAIKTFDELASSETGVVRLRAFRKASDAAFNKGDKPDLLLEYAKKAEELADCDRLEMARIINNRGRAFGWAGRGGPEMDLADYNAALQIFEEENSIPDVAEALWRSGVATYAVGQVENGLGKMLRSAAIFRDLADTRNELRATLYTGNSMATAGLFPEARREWSMVLRFGEELGIFTELFATCSSLSNQEEHDGKLEDALSQAYKALDYHKKTDAMFVNYDNFVRIYSKLGDLKRADEYFEKMPPEISLMRLFGKWVEDARAVYFTARNRWEESNQIFERLLDREDLSRHRHTGIGNEVKWRGDYAWALERQGRFEEAKVQRDMVQKLMEHVGERFRHTNLQMSVMVPRKVQVGEEFEMRLDLVNVGRGLGKLIRIEGSVPSEFKVASLPSFCSLQSGSIAMKDKAIGGFQVETLKLNLSVTKAGSYSLNPKVFCVDDSGTMKVFSADPVTIFAQPAKPAYEALPGRIPTGYSDLDMLLLGGIPENYAVVLTAPSCEERELLVNRFLRAGAEADETTFFITAEVGAAKAFAEQYPSSFYLFVCNIQADAVFQNMPYVFKLKGLESLTEIDIALMKAFRTLKPSAAGPRRICLDIVSDVLLQHHAVTTRRWLSALLPNFKSHGFTVLAVMNPHMHAQEEVQAILGLFQGEISISERETPMGLQQTLRIRKLYNQKYLENELILDKERLKQGLGL